MKTVLLLGDITGRSRVALRMLSTVLEAMGYEVLMLPTALISNTLNLGKHVMLDTTSYLLDSLQVWETLGIQIDLVYIGYVTGLEQAQKLATVADQFRAQGIPVVLDPILGDGGKKYNSVTEEQAQGMNLLCRHADLITPNLTEACLLAKTLYRTTEGKFLLEDLHVMGCDVLITSAQDEQGRDAVLGMEKGVEFAVPFERIHGQYGGTGDLFTALLISARLTGKSWQEAALEAVQGVACQLRGEMPSLLPQI